MRNGYLINGLVLKNVKRWLTSSTYSLLNHDNNSQSGHCWGKIYVNKLVVNNSYLDDQINEITTRVVPINVLTFQNNNNWTKSVIRIIY